MFETSYSDGQLWTQVASVHHEYGRLTLATAGLLYYIPSHMHVLSPLVAEVAEVEVVSCSGRRLATARRITVVRARGAPADVEVIFLGRGRRRQRRDARWLLRRRGASGDWPRERTVSCLLLLVRDFLSAGRQSTYTDQS